MAQELGGQPGLGGRLNWKFFGSAPGGEERLNICVFNYARYIFRYLGNIEPMHASHDTFCHLIFIIIYLTLKSLL